MTTKTYIAIIAPAHNSRGIYKLSYAGKVYYRLGNNVDNARGILGRELGINRLDIEILDEGKKQ